MKLDWLNLPVKYLSSKPGKISPFNFFKKVFRNVLLKFLTLDLSAWVPTPDFVKVRYSGAFVFWLFSIPLKPRVQPINEVEPIPVYVIISSSIFSNPYWDGHPSVEST